MLFVMAMPLYSQTMYYYYNGMKVKLTVDRSEINIATNDSTLFGSVLKSLNVVYSDDSTLSPTLKKIKLTTTLNESQYLSVVNTLNQNSRIKVLPYFVRNGATPIGTSDVFYVKLKNANDAILLRSVAERTNVQIVKQVPYMPLWYILSIQNSNFQNSVEASNYFYETESFEDVDPAFMFNFKKIALMTPCLINNGAYLIQETPTLT
jgi:hypothetical protein